MSDFGAFLAAAKEAVNGIDTAVHDVFLFASIVMGGFLVVVLTLIVLYLRWAARTDEEARLRFIERTRSDGIPFD